MRETGLDPPEQKSLPVCPVCGEECETVYTDLYDEVVTIENDAAFAASKLIAKKEGVLVGISSGAALAGAIELAKRPENEGKTIVVILPDSGDRYYSTPLFQG